MLRSEGRGVAFRHDLARMAVEDEVAPVRREELHRRALAALADSPGARPARAPRRGCGRRRSGASLCACGGRARSCAGSASRGRAPIRARVALRRRAPGERARRVCSSAQLARAVPDRRHRRRDRRGRGSAALRRALGEPIEEGRALCGLSEILWCPGRTADAERDRARRGRLLETLPEGRELANAYVLLGDHCGTAGRQDEAIAWASNGLALAHRLGDNEIALQRAQGDRRSQARPRRARGARRSARDREEIRRARGRGRVLHDADRRGARQAALRRRHRHIDDGIAFVAEHGLELYRYYMLAFRARLLLVEGRWDEAAELAAGVLRIRRDSIAPHVYALCVLGLVRARRGDPGAQALLDEAWALAEPTDEPVRVGPTGARARRGLPGSRATHGLSQRRATTRWRWRSSAATCPRRRARPLAPPRGTAAATGSRTSSNRSDAQRLRGSARADGHGRGGAACGARSTCSSGSAPRRPRRSSPAGCASSAPAACRAGRAQTTRENPAGLTKRELEVLGLVAAGLRDSEIAERLVLSERTVGHHVRAILRKLGVRNRSRGDAEAVAPRARQR